MGLEQLVEWLKLPTKTLVAIAIASGLLLFAGNTFNEFLGFTVFIESYRPWIGVIFLVFGVLAVVNLTEKCIKKVNRWYLSKKRHSVAIERLKNLTDDEKLVLKPYILDQKRSHRFWIDNGTVVELEKLGIIFRSSGFGEIYGRGFPYNMQPWVWEHLNNNVQFVLTTDEIDQRKKQNSK